MLLAVDLEDDAGAIQECLSIRFRMVSRKTVCSRSTAFDARPKRTASVWLSRRTHVLKTLY